MGTVMKNDTLFAGIVIAAVVILGVFLWQDGSLDRIGVLGDMRALSPRPAGTVPSENPPLPEEFTTPQATTSVPAVPLPLSEPTREVLGLKIFGITATPDGFVPSSLVFAAGDRVQIDVTAVGSRFDLGVPGLGAYLDVPEGETRSVSFDVNASGTYPFACRGFCPNGQEVSGVIIVQ